MKINNLLTLTAAALIVACGGSGGGGNNRNVPAPIVIPPAPAEPVSKAWNVQVLNAIRNDFARPTVHARNLWHTSGSDV